MTRPGSSRRPDPARLERARALVDNGRPEDALALLDGLGGSAEVDLVRARASKALGRTEDALAPLERVVAERPGDAGALILLADTCKALGRLAEAERRYRQAIDANPAMGPSWWALSNLKTARFSDADIGRMERHAESAPEPMRPFFAFALGRAHDDLGDPDAAFARYRAGNEAMRARLRWDRAHFRSWLDRVTAAQLEHCPVAEQPDDEGPRPLFIVSLPRSGSTLTEQILAAHRQVTAASELPWLPQLVAAEGRRRRTGLERWASAATMADWERLGAEYLEHTAWWRQSGPVFTDKLPGNHAYIGAALAMLPGARVVCLHREARDVCVSNYRQLYVRGNDFSYDLADLAAYRGAFERTTAEWARRYPGRVLALDYEALVTGTEAEARRLVAFAGLDWDERCLRPERARRAVNTASAAQVRSGIHRRGIGRWRRYRDHLGPLFEALADEAADD